MTNRSRFPPTDEAPAWLPLILAALTTVGPFSIDTYLLAFPSIGKGLHATPIQVQQTMSAYLGTFTFMMLWQGAIADALGRRRVILVGMVLYMLASLFCMFATSIEMLWLGRGLQGLTGGIGFVVSRAVVRDLYDGPLAQRLLARIGMLFALAPAVAPVIGGWIFSFSGWQGIFGFLALYSIFLLLLCWRFLPETLPPEQRQSLHPLTLWHGYQGIFGSGEFVRLAFAQAFGFNGLFIYIMSAPAFLIGHLKLSPQSFAWLFVPVVLGMAIGNYWSSKLAGRISQRRTLFIGYAVMAIAVAWNILLNAVWPPTVPWAILPIALYNIGMFLTVVSLQMLSLDLFPERRGMASSCQAFLQSILTTLVAGVVAPLLWGSTLTLAFGMAGFASAGFVLFLFSRAGRTLH